MDEIVKFISYMYYESGHFILFCEETHSLVLSYVSIKEGRLFVGLFACQACTLRSPKSPTMLLVPLESFQ
jgi:hypothetical protein